LQAEAQLIVASSPFGDQPLVGVVEEEEPLQLRTGRCPGEAPVRLCFKLLVRESVAGHIAKR